MGQFGIGQAVRRKEDLRLITGRGRYVDDLVPPDALHLHLVRSPHAHADILAVEVEAARRAPGVCAVYTIAELDAAGVRPLPCRFTPPMRDGRPMPTPERPALARGRVRHVGEPVVAIIAESRRAARDAADLVQISYRPLASVVDAERALADDAPQIWPEAPHNLALDWEIGDPAAVDEAFARAHRLFRLRLVNNRVVVNPMETRACLASYDPEGDRYRFFVGSQGVHGMRRVLAESVLGIPKEKLQVITGDVGGAFGLKIFVYPEYPICLVAARELGRPVAWMAERSEAFLADSHGRDHVATVTIAVDEKGRMTAIRTETVANLGAYLAELGPFIPTEVGGQMYCGVYRFEAAHYRVRCVFTNTQPTDAYRGAGRPEAAYAVERAVDYVARQLGEDPAAYRRRHFVPKEAMPWRTPLGFVYDSGDFARVLDAALERADARGFAERRRSARAEGRLLGLGVSYYIERCAGGPAESARLELAPDGRLRLLIGTQDNGQGHATAYSQLASAYLGVPFEAVEVVQGDSEQVQTGAGTGGSRSLPVGGAAVREASLRLIEKARLLASDLLEAAVEDLRYEAGRFRVAGTDRTLSLEDLARETGGIAEEGGFQPTAPTFPNGCHVCELAIDLDTAQVEILRYTVVDDFGTVINPLLVAGQVYGGVVQGIGQALFEHTVFDPETGQLLTASFLDYALPRAADVPAIDFSWIEIPCTTNPLGAKGAGEAGAIGAPPAVVNAVVDALAPFGVEHVDMPITPLRLFRILERLREEGRL